MSNPTFEKRLLGTFVRNSKIFRVSQEIGFDYLLNPLTNELHRCIGGTLFGSHNLLLADLGEFIGLTNVGSIPADYLVDGTGIPVYDVISGGIIGTYVLNKCRHCFPNQP